jgi:tRNA G18 (ribose-2'-O)-methylase SpoU
MPRVPIEDLDDARIEIYRHLKTTNKTRRLTNQFVVEGEKLFKRLIASPLPLVSVLVTDRYEPRIASCVPKEVPLYVVPHAAMSTLVGFSFHRGVLACGHRMPWPSLDDLASLERKRVTFLVCPSLESPENLGAIVRLGDAFGIDAILVGCGCPDPLSRRVLRVSMGGALRLPVLACDNLERDVERLVSEFGFELAAAVADPAAEPIESARRSDRFALLLGNESEGLPAEWLARCDRRITIPMSPGTDSLNVAVAAGIVLYHLQRSGS